MYAVEVEGFEKPAGVCGLNVLDEEPGQPVELNYALCPSAWVAGSRRVPHGSFWRGDARRLAVEEIVAITQEANRPSQQVLERLGFAHQRPMTRWGSRQRWYALSLRERGGSLAPD